MSAYGIDLRLTTRRPPVLHDGGLVTFGPAGDSYYYSRTRMEIAGTIDDHGERVPVKGLAWFDKQWGNFLVMGGGWDWFSMQLDDGSDLMLNLIRNPAGQTTIAYGTYVAPDGTFRHLTGSQFEVSALGSWTSPRTGITYPSGWRATVREPALDLRIAPVLADQELDTRRSTSLIYWEGAQTVVGTRERAADRRPGLRRAGRLRPVTSRQQNSSRAGEQRVSICSPAPSAGPLACSVSCSGRSA